MYEILNAVKPNLHYETGCIKLVSRLVSYVVSRVDIVSQCIHLFHDTKTVSCNAIFFDKTNVMRLVSLCNRDAKLVSRKRSTTLSSFDVDRAMLTAILLISRHNFFHETSFESTATGFMKLVSSCTQLISLCKFGFSIDIALNNFLTKEIL